MSYKDIKVKSNGGFYVESKDLFKNKKEVLERLERLQTLLNKIKVKKGQPYFANNPKKGKQICVTHRIINENRIHK